MAPRPQRVLHRGASLFAHRALRLVLTVLDTSMDEADTLPPRREFKRKGVAPGEEAAKADFSMPRRQFKRLAPTTASDGSADANTAEIVPRRQFKRQNVAAADVPVDPVSAPPIRTFKRQNVSQTPSEGGDNQRTYKMGIFK